MDTGLRKSSLCIKPFTTALNARVTSSNYLSKLPLINIIVLMKDSKIQTFKMRIKQWNGDSCASRLKNFYKGIKILN